MSDDTVGHSMEGEENIDDTTPDNSGSSGIEQEVIDIRQKHCHGDQIVMKTMKQALENAKIGGPSKDIQIIVVGKTGTGKSALINSIIDLKREIAKEGGEINRCSEAVQKYYCSNVVPGVNVTVIDTPGLQDIHQQEQSYIQKMKSKCGEVTLVLYCMKMTDHRLTNDDNNAMQKLYHAFGSKFWERVVFVLTFANKENCDQRDSRDEQDPEPPYDDKVAWRELIKKRFNNRILHRNKAVNGFLERNFSINGIPFSVAGTCKPSFTVQNPMSLPDRDNWLLDFLTLCCNEIKEKHRFSKLNLNYKIHFAIIIDNHEEIQGVNRVSKQVDALKKTFECLGFCVLYFNYLSSQSISHLLKAFHQIDHLQLASFALVYLSKGDTNDLYSSDKLVTFEEVFQYFDDIVQVPKLFLFHLAHSGEPLTDRLKFPNPPKNSIALAVSLKLTANIKVSPAIFSIIKNLKPEKDCVKPLKQCFEQMKHDIEYFDPVSCECKDTLQNNFVLPNCGKNEYQIANLLEKKHSLCYAMWYPLRCKTIDVILENKDEVMSIVRYERKSKVVTAAGGIVGAGMIGIGLLFAVPTWGASLTLSAAGGVVSTLSAGSSLISYLASIVKTNNRLKKAQQFVGFDQQFSNQLNAAAAQYNEALETYKEGAFISSIRVVVGAGAAGAAQLLVEEGGEIALRAASGVLVAVTVPIDVAQFVYNCYLLHESSQDETGQSDSNTTIQCLIKHFEASLKGFLHVTNTTDAYDGESSVTEYGYKVIVPPSASQDKPAATVSTILSGPFNLPDGEVLLSAVYDIMIDDNFKKSITVEIEHCVDVLDESIAGKMSFATAKADLKTKFFEICRIDGGTFPKSSTYGSIKLKESCLLCVLVNDQLKVRYAVQYSFTKNYDNFWLMKATFTKHLAAFTKFVSEDSKLAKGFSGCSFHLIEPNLELQEFKRTVIHNGWTIFFDDSNPKENIPKKSLDNIGLIKSGITLKEMIPFIRLFVIKGENSRNEFNFGITVPGTDLMLVLSINSCDFCN